MSEFNTQVYCQDGKMEINGCYCTFNSPAAKKDGECLGLPPHAPRKAFLVDEYAGCNESWMHGSSKAKSYFVPIQPEKGMWLDFNDCYKHTHHIAALISIQGVNPVTGMPLIDAKMRLEQYRHKCPKHDKDFGADLYCEECGYKWAPQNYLATTGTPAGWLWLDGFRADDGTVRQYYFTEEECKGIAAQVIGDKRVYAIGIAFYKSKTAKPPVQEYKSPLMHPMFHHVPSYGVKYMSPPATTSGSDIATFKRISIPLKKKATGVVHKEARKRSKGGSSASVEGIYIPSTNMDPTWSVNSPSDATCSVNSSGEIYPNLNNPYGGELSMLCSMDSTPVKQLEIGAGAKISQKIYRDPENLEFWEDAPIGMLYINYVQEDEAKRIIAIGKKDLTKKGEGFMAGLKVGK
jgi:hypothetical protein